jgi:hypothetical protein
MSGLLSIGPRDTNLVATKEAETAALRANTDTHYLMLRDIQIVSSIEPSAADGTAPAVWTVNPDAKLCDSMSGTVTLPSTGKREGYCQNPKDKSQIWLFTINGQRFPTMRVPNGRNDLLRLANLSASVTYVVSLRDASGAPVSFDLISVDGVVPGNPKTAAAATTDKADAIKISSLLLMPAARAEIFIANDNNTAADRRLVLQTDGLDTSAKNTTAGDRWPEVQLAEVILEGTPVVAANAPRVGLNEYLAQAGSPAVPAALGLGPASALPTGCVRDINRAELEHRRIMFSGDGPFSITTDLVHPKDKTKPQPFDEFEPDPAASLFEKA